MKIIKVIDLLNEIAEDAEVPKKIKYQNKVYIYNEDAEFYYINDNYKRYTLFSSVPYLDLTALIDFLNNEVEIIEDTPKEDKKIEKLRFSSHHGGTWEQEQAYRNKRDDEITTKINEIINKIRGE